MTFSRKKILNYFTLTEKVLWLTSTALVLISFFIFDRENYLNLINSLIGVTFLIFNAKGNPIGQFLTIVFSIIYGYIAFSFCYYGEVITYLGMSGPIAFLALISWLRNPYKGNRAEVKVNTLSKKETVIMFILSGIVTFIFYFILKHFNTTNLVPSTVSITTSFLASYLTLRRSPFYGLAYASNDLVLIILWAMATKEDTGYISVLICFIVFFFNDMYGFINWMRMKKRQKQA